MQPCVDVLGVNHQEILEKSDSIERFAEYGDTENKEITRMEFYGVKLV